MERVDLAVIGGGTAGLVASAGAAMLGAKVVLFEREALGGDCLWTGCVPSKALIRSAKVYHDARHGPEYGLPALQAEADFSAALARMRAVRARIEPHDSPERFRGLGVDVVLEGARLAGSQRVVSASRDVQARSVLLATGGRAATPPIPGLEEAGYLTHVEALEREHRPESIIVLGAGPIGLEFAQIYARFGARVTVVEMLDQVLPREDPEVAAMLRLRLEAEGIEVVTGHAARAVDRSADGRKVVRVGERALVAEEIFVATGRAANVEGLGLDEAGVETGDDGVLVNAAMRTTARNVYAAGDITGRLLFTHVADHEARLVVGNALLPLVRRKADYAAVPWVTYTDPELARIGLTEAEARERHGDSVQVFRFGFDDLDRAIVDGAAYGLVKLIADRRGRLLGAHILATGAGNLLAGPIQAIRSGTRLGAFSDAVYPYPTMSEGVRKAAEMIRKQALDGLGGRILKRIVRWAGVG